MEPRPLADQEQTKTSIDDKFTDELGVIISFLDLKAHVDAKTVEKPAFWSWRKTILFVLVTGMVGWSVVLGAVYLLFSLWD